jgi:spore germination cell wall hydrolase CwlJ-like protein
MIVFLLRFPTNNNDYNTDELKFHHRNSFVTQPPKEITIIKQIEEVVVVQPIQPTKLPEPVREVPTAHPDQVKCMAVNIYHEAAHEPFMGQVAVARVVMNRVKRGFAGDPCKVIYQKTFSGIDKEIVRCQFSWVCQGKRQPAPDNEQYQVAQDIARQVLAHDRWSEDFKDDILFFHSTRIPTQWTYHREFTIGGHVFYSTPKK